MKIKKSLLSVRCRLLVSLLMLIVLFEWPVLSAPQAIPIGGTNHVSVVQSASPTHQTSAQTTAKPNVVVCGILGWLIVIIIVAAIILGSIYYLCHALGLCGTTGDGPPNSPGTGTAAAIATRLAGSATVTDLVNSNVALPSVVYYVQNGLIVSNSIGSPVMNFPPLLSMNGQSIPNGSEIDSTTPGVTTPPSIAMWQETNTFYDTNLDTTYPYTVLLNYTLLTTTNLATSWQEAYTVVAWINDNPTTPLACSIAYTNGVPETTNWMQAFLDQNHKATNFVVYGTLPSAPISTNAVFLPADSGPPIPPGGGGTNGQPFSSTAQFFRLTCNTNAISTTWP